jgi:X-X-X-Leu-X-X-Gly heptad repeat protein
MQQMRQTLFSLGALLTMAGALMLWGCTSASEQATTDDVNDTAFTFPSGAVFHPALTNVATTLEFIDNANTFILSSGGGTASGNNRFGSCILTVTSSAYISGTGPQVNNVITLNSCNFDSTNNTLTVSNGPTTATSNPAVARATNATALDLNDTAFLFSSGEVFHPALAGLATTLEFTNNALTFIISSTAADGTASLATGTTTLTSGACTLAVTSSTYPVNTGPQTNNVITLRTCLFNSSSQLLIISNGAIAVSST